MRHLRLTFSLIAIAFSLCAMAQEHTPAQIARYKATKLAHQLQLSGSTESSFISTYESFELELIAITARKSTAPESAATTNEAAEQKILNDFKISHQVLELRERYFNEFKKILTPLQISEMYSFEKKNALMSKRGER